MLPTTTAVLIPKIDKGTNPIGQRVYNQWRRAYGNDDLDA